MAGIDENYVTVAQRIADFGTKHPQGCLRPLDPNRPFWIEAIGNKTFIVYVAAAYRTPDDELPGIGMAWEPFPGPTAFTRDSELQNAETSAWGRAIIAALAASSSARIASADEVRNRSGVDPNTGEVPGGGERPVPTPAPPSTGTRRRPPPGRPATAKAVSQREEGRSPTQSPSARNVVSTADGAPKGEVGSAEGASNASPPPTTPMVEGAMKAVLRAAQRKGLDVTEVTEMAGKPLEQVDSIEQVNAISQLVSAFGAKG